MFYEKCISRIPPPFSLLFSTSPALVVVTTIDSLWQCQRLAGEYLSDRKLATTVRGLPFEMRRVNRMNAQIAGEIIEVKDKKLRGFQG